MISLIGRLVIGKGKSSLGQAAFRSLKSTHTRTCLFFLHTGTMLEIHLGCWTSLMKPAAMNLSTARGSRRPQRSQVLSSIYIYIRYITTTVPKALSILVSLCWLRPNTFSRWSSFIESAKFSSLYIYISNR